MPAHRGLVVLVFEDLELADYGNRIPNITAEIAWRAVPRYPVQPLQFASGPISSFSRTELAVDWRRGQGFLAGSSPAGLRRFTTRSMVEDRQVTQGEVLASTGGLTAPASTCLFSGIGRRALLHRGQRQCPAHPAHRSGRAARGGALRQLRDCASNGTTRFTLTQRMAMITRGGAHHLLTANGIGPEHLGLLAASTLDHVWHENGIGGTIAALTGGAEGEGWALTASSATLRLHRIAVGAARGDVRRSVDAAFAPWDIDPGATAFATGDAGGLNFDPTDGGLVFWCGVTGPGIPARQYVLKWRPGLGLLWRTAVPIWPSGFANRQPVTTARLTGDGFAMARDSAQGGGTWRVIRLDLRSGAITLDASGWVNGASGLGGAQVYDGLTDSLIAYDPNGRFARLALGRVGRDPRALSGIVSDLCARAGLGPGDVDVSDLAGITVPGFVLSRQGSVRSAIEPLARAFFFDGVESDDRLAFRTRGRAPAASLDPALLIPLEGGGSVGGAGSGGAKRARPGASAARRRSTCPRASPSSTWTQAPITSRARRPNSAPPPPWPRATSSPPSCRSCSAPAPRAASPPARSTPPGPSAAALRRCCPATTSGSSPPMWSTSTLPSGSSFRVRIEQVDLGADFTLSLRAVSQEPASYDITRAADGGQGRPEANLDGAPETRVFLPDLPLLRDIDAPAGALSRLHAFMGGYGTGPWTGAALFRSADRVNWALWRARAPRSPMA